MTHIFSHLPPSSLSAISLVSHRFHGLVTTPHAWRLAFSRYFPGSIASGNAGLTKAAGYGEDEDFFSEKRLFNRLTALASWRSEYILRTRLLRSLARGKPAHSLGSGGSTSRSSAGNAGNAQLTYNSNLLATVNHLDATFGTGLNKKLPHFIHGADEVGMASSSDPNSGKLDSWGFTGPSTFLQFTDRFPGETEYGLGQGDIVGVPNSMDVSQMYGMVHAEGSPGGMIFFRPIDEQLGRFLAFSQDRSCHELGIPKLDADHETMCSVWIAKSTNIPDLTNGLIGILSGSSYGVLNSYSLGTSGLRGRRPEKGEITARWVISPGVPIVAIRVDDDYSRKRLQQSRIWVTVLNALGEVYYLTTLPERPNIPPTERLSRQKLDEMAWVSGRTVSWSLVEPTRRTAAVDPYEMATVPGSYTPMASWDGIKLSKEQLVAETREVEKFLKEKPKFFRGICDGWDMRRRLEVDFAGDDGNNAGETVFVVSCGLEPDQHSRIDRYSRTKTQSFNERLDDHAAMAFSGIAVTSVLGSPDTSSSVTNADWSFRCVSPTPGGSVSDLADSVDEDLEIWRTSSFVFGGLKPPQITATASDTSMFALLTVSEDPLLSLSTSSVASSPVSSPIKMPRPHSPSKIPGQRCRFLAVGTITGSILLWNMRAPLSSAPELTNTIEPIRVIHTDSPQISCLGLSALYLVHGGNDGLVQAWDPLASNAQPIRTLNSRFSSRARRRLVQAEASPYGVGINLFAAGAICLDPDPTVLRGMVSLGTHLRYWSYSSQAADQYKSNKRRLRRGQRGSNHSGEKFSRTGRGALKDYITNERLELAQEKENRRRENARLAGRFGVDLLGPGATEDEIMAYATMLSEEAALADEARRSSSSSSSDTITEEVMSSPITLPTLLEDEDDIARAIQLSLQENDQSYYPPPVVSPSAEFSVRYIKGHRSPSRSPPRATGSSSQQAEVDDLDFALQLSLAEEASRAEVEEEFPALRKSPSPSRSGKGKQRLGKTKEE